MPIYIIMSIAACIHMSHNYTIIIMLLYICMPAWCRAISACVGCVLSICSVNIVIFTHSVFFCGEIGDYHRSGQHYCAQLSFNVSIAGGS